MKQDGIRFRILQFFLKKQAKKTVPCVSKRHFRTETAAGPQQILRN